MRGAVTAWLVLLGYLAAWDAAAFALQADTFAVSYGRAFDLLPPAWWAGWLAGTAVAAVAGAGWSMAGTAVPAWYLGLVALGHGFVCATFGWALFSISWSAGTGANKWLVWAVVDAAIVGTVLSARRD